MRWIARPGFAARPLAPIILGVVALALAGPLALLATARAQQPDAPLWNEDQEKLVSKEPPFAIQRPNKEWVFIDLARAKKAEAARLNSPSQAEENYRTVKARLYHGGNSADLFVYVLDDPREGLDSGKVGEEQLAGTKAVLKEAKVTAAGPTKLSKRAAYAFEVEGKLGEKVLAVSKVVVYREEDKKVFVISLECPKEKAKAARKDLPKLLKGIQL
jgi:hypothetical protein